MIGTWNGNWFPSGRAEHRAHPDVEAATATAAAKMLAEGLRAVDPAGTNDVILCLSEIRGPRAATNLVAQIGRKGLRMVVISGYRRRDRFDQQQDVIATTLPVAEAHWSRWKASGKVTPPRGYAFAAVVIDPATTANVYAVHLKSNYGATKAETREANREKREIAARQLAKIEKGVCPVIVAGDFNADRWSRQFVGEKTFAYLDEIGMTNVLARLPSDRRGTHPSKTYGNSALDNIYCRGFEVCESPHIIANQGLSDHLAVFALLSPLSVRPAER